MTIPFNLHSHTNNNDDIAPVPSTCSALHPLAGITSSTCFAFCFFLCSVPCLFFVDVL